MPGLKLQVTNAGRAALVNLPNTGTNAVLIAQVGIANAPFVVSAGLTALPNEVKRLAAVGGSITADDTIHVSIRDESTSVYDCYGFGLYLSDGTLFAVYCQPELLLGKAAAAMMLLALDAVFTDIDVQQLTFGDTNFTDPAATTEVPGIVELATEAEATTGTDKVRAITAFLLKKVLDARFGAGAPSEFVKGLLGLATAALLRGALELKGAALKDEGAGKGLDADKLDGQHGDYYLQWDKQTGKPDTYPPSPHPHVIADVAGLADALDAKFNRTGGQVDGSISATGTVLGSLAHAENRGYMRIGSYDASYGAGSARIWYNAKDNRLTFWDSTTSNPCNFAIGEISINGSAFAASYAVGDKLGLIYQTDATRGTVGVRAGTTSSRYWSFDGADGTFRSSNGGGSFAGAVTASGGFQPSSSRELKTAFRPNPYGLNVVLQLQVQLGKYRKWFNKDGRERVFLFHEDIAQLIPQAASGAGIQATPPGANEPRRFGGYDLDQLVAVYAQAFQDMHALHLAAMAEVRAELATHAQQITRLQETRSA